MQIRKKLRSLEGLLQFRGNEQEISHTAHKLSVGAFALQSALDKVRTCAWITSVVTAVAIGIGAPSCRHRCCAQQALLKVLLAETS
jgi:hypothetical protein